MDTRFDHYTVARALHLDAERTGYGHTYWISGGERRHLVSLETDCCDCYQRVQLNRACKHLARALMAEGDANVLRELRWFIPLPNARHLT